MDEGGEDVAVGGNAVAGEMRGEEGEGRAGEGGVGEVGKEGGPSDGVCEGNKVEQVEGVAEEGGAGVGAEEEVGERREEVEAELEEVGVEAPGGGGRGLLGSGLEEGEEVVGLALWAVASRIFHPTPLLLPLLSSVSCFPKSGRSGSTKICFFSSLLSIG